jgi:ribose 5-phosphate isomerase B
MNAIPGETFSRMASERIAVASDHGGVGLKPVVEALLGEMGYQILNLGTDGPESVDYPDYADKMASALKSGEASRGVLICGTGIGMSIAINRHPHVRAARCQDVTDARLSREHNDANVLVLGARTIGPETARDCIRTFMTTAFEGGRHQRRVDKMS